MPRTSQNYFQHKKDIIMTQTSLKHGSLTPLYLINSTNKHITEKMQQQLKKKLIKKLTT